MSELRPELVPNVVEIFYGPHQEAVNMTIGEIDDDARQMCLELLRDNGFQQPDPLPRLAAPKHDPETPLSELHERLAKDFPIGQEAGASGGRRFVGPHPNIKYAVAIWEAGPDQPQT